MSLTQKIKDDPVLILAALLFGVGTGGVGTGVIGLGRPPTTEQMAQAIRAGLEETPSDEAVANLVNAVGTVTIELRHLREGFEKKEEADDKRYTALAEMLAMVSQKTNDNSSAIRVIESRLDHLEAE